MRIVAVLIKMNHANVNLEENKMKSIYFNTFATVLFLPFSMATNLYAADEHAEHEHEKHEKMEDSPERVQHGSHEHGAARLTVAKTDVGMEISLEAPAINLFGFGHQANDKEEHQAVQTTKEKLNAGETLFIANKAAKCKLKEVDIESDIVSSHEKEKKNAHHEHEDNHDNDKKKHDHDKHDEKEATHSDVDITWLFTCEKPKALESVETKLFSQFPKGFQHLNVEWITSNGAGTVKLEADGSVKVK